MSPGRAHVLLSAMFVIVAALTQSACAAGLAATPDTVATVFASAQGGDTIALAAGDYGTFTGAMKAGEVTLAARPGATVRIALDFDPASNITIDGLTLTSIEIADGASRNITVRNSDIPGQTTLRTGELANANILFDHNVHRDFDVCANCAEGRVFLPGNTSEPSGITIRNSEFRGGLSDGISNGSNGTRIIDNVFHDLTQGSPDGVHTDAIQLYGSKHTLIKGNYMYHVPQAIMASSGADHEIIEDNVFDPGEYPFPLVLYSDDSSIVRHNTLPDGACAFHARCGIMTLGSMPSCPHPSECDPGHGTVIEDNVMGEISFGEGTATVAQSSNNLLRTPSPGPANLTGLPVYVGGSHPTSFAGFALARGSKGRGNASDGLDRGIRLSAGGAATGGGHRRGPAASSATVRVLSTLRSMQAGGKLRLRVTTPQAGAVTITGAVRPGPARRGGSSGHSRRLISLGTTSLGQRKGGGRTVSIQLSRRARRILGRSRSARLSVGVRVGASVTRVRLAILAREAA
jgi:parallel beta helix pectate lyase-like protein